jgi:hypothetical protein
MGWIYHVRHPIKKHVENSIRGIRRAARRLFVWIDLDLLITKADPECPLVGDEEHVNGVCLGHIVGTHWDRPMLRDGFFDPEGLLSPRTTVRQMTLEEALRLKTKDGYRIKRVRVLLRECALRGIGAYVEAKDDKRFELDWPWRYLKAAAKQRGCRLRARTIRNFPVRGAGRRRAQAARRNGVRCNTIRG